MKNVFFAVLGILVAAQANAKEGYLVCNGKKHAVIVDSKAQTIQVTPEMKEAVPAHIVDGPEKGLYAAYDTNETFVVYLGEKNGKVTGVLQSAADDDLEEKLTCKGTILTK